MNSQDEILNYVLKKENLPATLDIISRAAEIRSAALQQFWQGLLSHLRQKAPQRFAKLREVKWEFYPLHNPFVGQYTNLYYCDKRLPDSGQSLRYSVRHYKTNASFEMSYGIAWWEKAESAKSNLLRLPSIVKLRQELGPDQFKCNGWWLGRSELFRADGVEDFLKRYAGNPKQVEGKVADAFWRLAEDTYELVEDANRAIQRAKSK